MGNVVITADSAADLPKEIAEKYGIQIMPMYFISIIVICMHLRRRLRFFHCRNSGVHICTLRRDILKSR